jgi:membrane protein implicated in regulation of membrane protease activity
MSPRTARRLALALVALGAGLWFGMPAELWPQRLILVLTIALVAVTCFDRARFPGDARTDSTMGPAGDALIGSRARVVSLQPLKVEARGAVWNAREAGMETLAQQGLVEVVGREGLTLLVRRPGAAGPQGG